MERKLARAAPPYIAPSVLSADFAHLAEAVSSIAAAGGDLVHLDVMDGSFVPNITFGPKMVRDLRPHSPLPFDVHLMVREPERHLEAFLEAGADYLTIHLEAVVHHHRVLTRIRELGGKPGISIVPSTPVCSMQEVAALCDLVLVMTVDPGYGGQSLIPETLRKVSELRELRSRSGCRFLLEVDGGVNPATAAAAVAAGADILVAGSSVFDAADPARVIAAMRGRQ